jgi:uncharacterized protein YutE (UPF0331/DUF86 family)
MNDVILNKAATIERCLHRVREVYAGDDHNLREDLTRQDSIVLNLQRACEAAIDLAMHLVREHHLGIPQDSREAFDLLSGVGLYPRESAEKLRRMVGFRNVAVHDYQALNLDIVREIIRSHTDDLGRLRELGVGEARDEVGRREGWAAQPVAREIPAAGLRCSWSERAIPSGLRSVQ